MRNMRTPPLEQFGKKCDKLRKVAKFPKNCEIRQNSDNLQTSTPAFLRGKGNGAAALHRKGRVGGGGGLEPERLCTRNGSTTLTRQLTLFSLNDGPFGLGGGGPEGEGGGIASGAEVLNRPLGGGLRSKGLGWGGWAGGGGGRQRLEQRGGG